PSRLARMAELVDALDLGSSGLAVRVQVPLLAPQRQATRLPLVLATGVHGGNTSARPQRRPMRTELVDKKAVEATVKVTVPAADVNAAYEQVISELARQVRVPGFRQGRVPRGVLVKRVGPEALNEEVKEKLIDAHFQAALKEHELLPISTHFHAHQPIQGADFTFEIHSELYPEVTLPDLSAITLTTEKRELTEDLVTEAVAELQRENATLVPVDRPVEPTDWVMIEATSL